MRKRLSIIAIVGISLFAAARGISLAGLRTTLPTEIDTVEAHKIQHLVDNRKPGFGVGDILTVSVDLDTVDGTTKLGHLHEVCTVIHPIPHVSFECFGTAEFADGQVALTGEFPPVDPDNSGAVVGGTGAYENAGGKVVSTAKSGGVLELTFFLVP